MKIASLEPLILHVSDKTNWFFIRITAENGLTGLGEATLNGWESAQMATFEAVRTAWVGKSMDDALPFLEVYPHSPGGLIASSISSALEQALVDLRAKQSGVPVHRYLGGKAVRKSVRVYANINRGTRDRSPDGFAQAARNAVAAGYGAVKIAAFDGVLPNHPNPVEQKRLVQLGIDRLHAIREAVGPDIDIMVDCHWRFDEAGAVQLVRDLHAIRLYWLECPTSENPDGFSTIQRVHEETAASGIKLAGAERQIAVSGFKPFVAGGWLDVVMPDIKYAGGYSQMLKIAELCAKYSVGFSPHNPSGPVCNMASIQLCAIAPAFLILEYQLAESPLYFDVAGGFVPKLANGCFEVPETPGIGIELKDEVLRAHPYQSLAPNANLDPRLG